MSRTIKKVRIVKTLTRALGSGVQETFWEVQERRPFKWHTVGVYPSSADACTHAAKSVSL